jgi:hypothetical protein
MNTKETQTITRDNFDSLYSNKLGNLDTYDHPKLSQEENNNPNRSITHNELNKNRAF